MKNILVLLAFLGLGELVLIVPGTHAMEKRSHKKKSMRDDDFLDQECQKNSRLNTEKEAFFNDKNYINQYIFTYNPEKQSYYDRYQHCSEVLARLYTTWMEVLMALPSLWAEAEVLGEAWTSCNQQLSEFNLQPFDWNAQEGRVYCSCKEARPRTLIEKYLCSFFEKPPEELFSESEMQRLAQYQTGDENEKQSLVKAITCAKTFWQQCVAFNDSYHKKVVIPFEEGYGNIRDEGILSKKGLDNIKHMPTQYITYSHGIMKNLIKRKKIILIIGTANTKTTEILGDDLATLEQQRLVVDLINDQQNAIDLIQKELQLLEKRKNEPLPVVELSTSTIKKIGHPKPHKPQKPKKAPKKGPKKTKKKTVKKQKPPPEQKPDSQPVHNEPPKAPTLSKEDKEAQVRQELEKIKLFTENKLREEKIERENFEREKHEKEQRQKSLQEKKALKKLNKKLKKKMLLEKQNSKQEPPKPENDEHEKIEKKETLDNLNMLVKINEEWQKTERTFPLSKYFLWTGQNLNKESYKKLLLTLHKILDHKQSVFEGIKYIISNSKQVQEAQRECEGAAEFLSRQPFSNDPEANTLRNYFVYGSKTPKKVILPVARPGQFDFCLTTEEWQTMKNKLDGNTLSNYARGLANLLLCYNRLSFEIRLQQTNIQVPNILSWINAPIMSSIGQDLQEIPFSTLGKEKYLNDWISTVSKFEGKALEYEKVLDQRPLIQEIEHELERLQTLQ